MSEVAAPSAKERLKRAKLREIEAHRRAIDVHENIGHFFESVWLDAQAAAVRERAEFTRAKMEVAIREAEALSIE